MCGKYEGRKKDKAAIVALRRREEIRRKIAELGEERRIEKLFTL